LDGEIPLSIGGGIGQARNLYVPVKESTPWGSQCNLWPQILKDICAEKNIYVLE